MAINKSARDSMVVIAVIAAFAVTVMANLLADRKFVRLDLTKEKRYSLSEPFRNILGCLKDTTKVTYYVSADPPGWFAPHKRDILDKLKEIETASGGKLVLEVIDPTSNPELVQRLAQNGFRNEVQEVKTDAINVTVLYTGLEITYQAKPKAFVPAIGSGEDVEYLLGSKIKEMTLEKKPIIMVQAPAAPPQMQMMGRQGAQSGYEWLQQGAWDDSKKFEVRPLGLSEISTIAADTALVILIRPKELDERQRYEVAKYLAGGGRVLLIASPFKVSHEFGWRVEKTPTGLEDYLKEFGFTFGPDFVCDNSNMRMLKSINLFNGKKEYSKNPFFIKVLRENMDQEHVLTRLMPGLMMPSPAEIVLNNEQIAQAGLKATVLAKTSKQSWTIPFSDAIDPETRKREANYDENGKTYESSKNILVMLEGQFPFPYEGKPVPEWPKGPESTPSDPAKKTETASVTKKEGLLIACSSPEAFHSMYLDSEQVGQLMQANVAIIVNIAENVSMGEDLIKLRAKRYEARTIDQLPGTENDRKRTAIKLALIIGMPLLLAFAALARVGLRRLNQNRYERKFSETTGPSSFTP
jgi:ABC-type uncharacterized transport system involved in gliding motility auxiliary subunit